MNENFFENEILSGIKPYIEAGTIKIIADSAPLFAGLAKAYPILGSKIDWNSVPNSIQASFGQSVGEIEKFKHFFCEVVQNHRLDGKLIYAGDSSIDFALEGSIKDFIQLLPTLFSLPQHHYFFDESYAWCMCFSFEGDATFGYRPKAPLP